MRSITFLFFVLFLCQLTLSQQLIDVVSAQGITDHQNFIISNTNGMSFFDFDEDGWDDITYPANNDSIIFYKNINGNFQKIGSFVYAFDITREILWVDYDNDNDLDLAVSYANAGFRLYSNDGNFNFTDVTFSIGLFPSVTDAYGFSFADPDADSDLDLYLGSYGLTDQNKFFQNQGDGTFLDFTDSIGLSNQVATTFMPVWFDFNNDEKLELHVINDREEFTDKLYSFNDTLFVEISDSVGISNPEQNPMTISISDFDNDGYQDIFITDLGSGQSPISGLPQENKLFKNNGGVNFQNIAPLFGLEEDVISWGALWVDYNNDCFEDLFVTSGEFSSSPGNNEFDSFFYRNEAGQSFVSITDSIIGDHEKTSFCAVKGDINNDGFYDIAVLNKDTLMNLLLNQTNNNNYIKITPVGLVSNRMAIGSQIRVYANGQQQLQTVFCGEGLASQSSQHKIFGVGNANIVDSIIINFPSGLKIGRYNVPVNQSIEITEEESILVEVQLNQTEDTLFLCPNGTINLQALNVPNFNWSNGSTDTLLEITQPGVYYFETTSLYGDTIYRSMDITVINETAPLFSKITALAGCDSLNLGSAELLFVYPQEINQVIWETGDTNFVLSDLVVGTYPFSIYTVNGCEYYDSVEISQTPSVFFSFTTQPVTDTTLGEVSIFPFGGTPPYSYFLDGDSVGMLVNNLESGVYDLLLIDAVGCSAVDQFFIADNSTAGIYGIPNFSQGTDSEIDFRVKLKDGTIFIDWSDRILNRIKVFSISGQQLADISPMTQNKISFPFDYPAGLYSIVFQFNDELIPYLILKD